MMVDDRLRTLFLDLGQLQHNKEPRVIYLTDIAEIVAVAGGMKPAHLNGQGFLFYSPIDQLERLATRHGLLTLRTKRIKSYKHRKPRYDQALYRWESDREEHDRQVVPDVLWIFRDAYLVELIHEAVAGKRDVSKLLGYPECCVHYKSEYSVRLNESYVEALGRDYRPRTSEEYIKLFEEDAGVRMKMEPSTTAESGLKFPYVQFDACPSCLKSSKSPASKVNRSMRDLAFRLSETYGREIWEAQYEAALLNKKAESAGGKVTSFEEMVCRNAPCPCGSGKKYKRCCGRQ